VRLDVISVVLYQKPCPAHATPPMKIHIKNTMDGVEQKESFVLRRTAKPYTIALSPSLAHNLQISAEARLSDRTKI
jgi:hypothetical protein